MEEIADSEWNLPLKTIVDLEEGCYDPASISAENASIPMLS